MCLCISLFEEGKPRLIGVSTLREVECSRSSLIHHMIPLLHVHIFAREGDSSISRSFVGIFKILSLQIEVIIDDGVDPVRIAVEDKTINT